MVETRLSEINLQQLCDQRENKFNPSPTAWEDQVIYFLMLDRFSDGNEKGYKDNNGETVQGGATLMYDESQRNNVIKQDGNDTAWQNAGVKWVGGTLKGLCSKLGYLKRMGVTTIWISPVFKQVAYDDHKDDPTWGTSYHGYGIQNFLNVDPRFGEREDLKELVKTAHDMGLYVILDIILNHSGDVFDYTENQRPSGGNWDGQPYAVKGFRDEGGKPTLPFGPLNGQADAPNALERAIWPAEFQNPGVFTTKGRINNWNYFPEYLEGDFVTLKDIHHGQGDIDQYQPSPALKALCEIYKFWIAYTDIDGFRIDTVKHMDPGATRFFASIIQEFTQSIGKEKFYQIGEITGGRSFAFETLAITGLDAALGVDEIPDKLEGLVKGTSNPSEYFDLFRNSFLINKDSHTWFRNKVVTMVDDHDKVCQGSNKARFCAEPGAEKLMLAALALNATTLGIPCVYYGSEQAFDGHTKDEKAQGNDRFLREAMFGGKFGSFKSRDYHFFNEDKPIYQELAKILKLRQQPEMLALRRGRQYLREISGPDDGYNFGVPQKLGDQMLSVVPWSRLLDKTEILVAINTDPNNARTAWVTIDSELHQAGNTLQRAYSTDPNQTPDQIKVENHNGRAVVRLTVPPAGFVIYK
jgi:glycosidase